MYLFGPVNLLLMAMLSLVVLANYAVNVQPFRPEKYYELSVHIQALLAIKHIPVRTNLLRASQKVAELIQEREKAVQQRIKAPDPPESFWSEVAECLGMHYTLIYHRVRLGISRGDKAMLDYRGNFWLSENGKIESNPPRWRTRTDGDPRNVRELAVLLRELHRRVSEGCDNLILLQETACRGVYYDPNRRNYASWHELSYLLKISPEWREEVELMYKQVLGYHPYFDPGEVIARS